MTFKDFQPLTIFAKQFILYVWQGSEYASGLLKLFCPGSKRDAQECLLYISLIIVFTPNKIQVNRSITKIKEEWSIIQFDAFDLCFIFFHSNVPENNCHRQKCCVLFFTCIKLVVCVLVCACAIARIKWRRLFYDFIKMTI